MNDPIQTTVCPTCKGEGKILFMWARGDGPPGNGYGGCPDCPDGRSYNDAEQAETEVALKNFRSNLPAAFEDWADLYGWKS